MSSHSRSIAIALVPADQVADASTMRVFPEHPIVDTIGTVAWDPYDIWLRCVKLPRESAARATPKVAA